MKKTRKSGAHRAAFTIIEVIVIVVIIGVIAATIATRLFSRIGESRQSMAASNASSLATQIQSFIVDHGSLESGMTIDILWERPSSVEAEDWEPYVQKADDLLDPWGNKFVLRVPGEVNYDFDVISYGADGQPGGTGEDGDIVKP